MMASYLAGTGGHVPDSIKHLLPDMQQYWSAAAHSEGNHCFLQHLAFLLKDAILVEEKKNCQTYILFSMQSFWLLLFRYYYLDLDNYLLFQHKSTVLYICDIEKYVFKNLQINAFFFAEVLNVCNFSEHMSVMKKIRHVCYSQYLPFDILYAFV